MIRRVGLGLIGAWLLLLGELAVVAFLRRAQLASSWELAHGTGWLAPSALSLGSALGLAGSATFWLFERSEQPRWRATLTAILALAAAAVGYGVGGGRHLAAPAVRVGFALALALVALAASWFALPPLRARHRQAPGSFAAALVALVGALEIANQRVLPRLYPAFHRGLAAACGILAAWIALCVALPAPAQSRRPDWSAVALLVALATPLLIAPSAPRLANFDNFRLLLLEGAPLLGNAVELAARVAPPLPFTDACADRGPAACPQTTAAAPSGSGGLDWRGRDLLLVSIDALRADHVGAYGYARGTTPTIDRLAASGALFEHAYSATPHTSYAVTSLMTGKHMRPLLELGAGADSDTFATLLRTYGYHTAAFYPPAVFFIDSQRFETFRKSELGFEYAKVEFAEGEPRVAQVASYLEQIKPDQKLFLWVHLFSPHEPYVPHPEFPFGDRDIDRYDSEIAEADHTLGRVVELFRRLRPNGVVVVTADHGEEFGEHGGRYHGTTVYEEQVRVPLVISAPGAVGARRFAEVVQSIDVLPTVLSALDIPRPARVRGRDLSALIAGKRAEEPGQAYAETDEQSLLARGSLRLVCARRIGACKLHDLSKDPGELLDAAPERSSEAQQLREALREVASSHGRYESQGLRAEGKGWPAPLLRGLSGDADAAGEVASLLDDVDPQIRRKSAEVLLQLRRPETAPALRLALGRDDDPEVRKLAALALTRLGEGAPLVIELLNEPKYQRQAALALAESGDKRGEAILIEWWRAAVQRDFQQSRDMLAAFATLRARDAVPWLVRSLDDVRLRPFVAKTLAAIGEESARVPLARALAEERSQSARSQLAEALVALGGREEMAQSVARFLGVPDPLANGLDLALRAHILQFVGGPGDKELARVRQRSELGTRFRVFVPKGGNGRGVRALVRASCPKNEPAGEIVISSAAHLERYDSSGKLLPERGIPALDLNKALRLRLPCSGEASEVFGTLPENLRARPGGSVELVLFASRSVQIAAVALVPLADELPPPPPKPWSKDTPGG